MGETRIYLGRSVSTYSPSLASSPTSAPYLSVDYQALEGQHKNGASKLRREIHRLKAVVAVCLVLTFFSLVCSSAGLAFGDTFVQITDLEPQTTSVCLPCDSLMTSPSTEEHSELLVLQRRDENSTLVCCASSTIQYQALFELMMKRKLTQNVVQAEIATENQEVRNKGSADKIPFAYVQLGRRPKDADADDMLAPQTEMKRHPFLSEVSGIKLLHDRLIIEKGGLYLIYSQVFFENPDPSVPRRLATEVLSHYVFRFNVNFPGNDELLMKSLDTQCWGDKRPVEFHTSHMAGVFMLQPYDQLYVKVSPIRFLSRDPQASYFGISRLGDVILPSR